MKHWSPSSWSQKPIAQAITYPCPEKLACELHKIKQLPPLVSPSEVDQLKKQLGEAALGQRFVLQGGDCAELFDECDTSTIAKKLKLLLHGSLVLGKNMGKPVLRIGRMAGQYAKPRSELMETRGELSFPSYRGDLVNATTFSEIHRTPDPKRLLQGYHNAATTLNFIRSIQETGGVDLLKGDEPLSVALSESITLLKQLYPGELSALPHLDFFTSHEAHHLPFEEALTRRQGDKWYNLSTHFPWIGMRTSQIDHAHVEYVRGIENPVAIKIGPSVTPDEITALTHQLNPHNEPGALTFITRLGVKNIAEKLPQLIQAVQKTSTTVLWLCDPMHGNTYFTKSGKKTRHVADMLEEITLAHDIHAKHDSYLGGLHLEMTGNPVTECVGGPEKLAELDLMKAYHSPVDPRLNGEQALDLITQFAKGVMTPFLEMKTSEI